MKSAFQQRLEEQMDMENLYPKQEKKKTNIMTGLLVMLGIILYIPTIAIARAYVIGTLWFWYIVPALELNPLTMVQAFGMSLIVGLFTNSYDSKYKRDYNEEQKRLNENYPLEEFWRLTKYQIGKLIMGLILGYIGTLFM